MLRPVELVRQRLLRATAALEGAHVPDAAFQRAVSVAVKRARFVALLPYVGE